MADMVQAINKQTRMDQDNSINKTDRVNSRTPDSIKQRFGISLVIRRDILQ